MHSTLAVIVTFFPGSEVINNVQKILSQVTSIIVIDNGSSEECKAILSSLSSDKVSVIFNEHNLGVATGFNQGILWGLNRGFDYFLLFDQDSCPELGMTSELFKVMDETIKNNPLVLIGPRHEDRERKIRPCSLENVSKAPLLITSGSLISRSLIDAVGLYDERLFIDHVDHDYCLRVVKNGGICLKVNSAILLHRFGKAEVKTFLGKSFFLQDYAPIRRYHMMRNRIVLYKRYGMFKGEWFWLDAKVAIKDLVKLIIFEDMKYLKLAAVFQGIFDGLFWKD